MKPAKAAYNRAARHRHSDAADVTDREAAAYWGGAA